MSQRDASATVSSALPAANANNATAALLIGSPGAGEVGRINGRLEIDVEALTALTAGSVTLTIEDSADGVSGWATAPGYGNLTIAGGAGGSARFNRLLSIHHFTRPYVRLRAAVTSDGGNNTARTYLLALVL